MTVCIFSAACSETNLSSLKSAAEPVEPVETETVDTAAPELDTADPPSEPEPEPEPEPEIGPPMADVSHDHVDLGVVCGDKIETVTVTSTGESPLEVSDIQIVGTGWIASHLPLPVTLEPEETFDIHLMSSDGTATLLIVTNEPDGSPIELPLVAAADQPPYVLITSPAGGEVLSPGMDTVFQARVLDDADASDSLSIEWTSNMDGLLSTEPPSTDGTATLDWSGTTRTSGDHRVELKAADSCGNEAVTAVGFCQNEGYTEDSIDLSSWHFEGTALWDTTNGWVELTGPYTNQAGTAFQTTSTVSSEAINIEFSFYVSGGSGADGISLTAIDSERMTSFVGGTGGGIGYAGLPGWSVEIDTWYNSVHNDPTASDHLSVHIDGNVNTPYAWAALPEMEDDGWHLASINVEGSHMTIAIDGVVYIDETVSGLGSFPAYVGFTGATGAATNYHLIDALEVEGFVCEE